jgi:hypothetical protein
MLKIHQELSTRSDAQKMIETQMQKDATCIGDDLLIDAGIEPAIS